MMHGLFLLFFTRGQFWPLGIVVVCVCVCVSLSVRLSAVFTKSRQHVCHVRRKIQMSDVGFVKIIIIWCLRLPIGRRRVKSIREDWSVYLSVCQSHACPRDNSRPVQARITKFGTKMQNTLVKVPIVLWNDRPWPSRSNLTWESKFTSFWACPHHNSSPIQARIIKFGPEVQNNSVKILIVLGAIDLDLEGQIWLKSQIFRFPHYWKYITTT